MNPSSHLTGPLLVLGHFLDLGATTMLLLVGLGLGLAMLRALRLLPDDPLAALSFGTVLGLGALANAFLALGASGLLHSWSLGVVLLGAVLLGRRELLGLPSLLCAVPPFARRWGGWGFSLAWGLVVLGGVGVFLLVQGGAPPVDWDSLMYHLSIPTRFLEEGRIVLPPDNLHFSFVGLFHMLYLPLLAAGRTAGTALLNGALAILLGLTLFSMGARFLRAADGSPGDAGSLSLGAVWGTTTLILVAMTPRTDVSLALFLLLAHYAFLLALEEERWLAWACLGALLVGFAAGIKFNGLAYGAGLAPLALWIAWTRGQREGADPALQSALRRIQRPASAALLMAGVGLAALAPWLVKNWIVLGSPLYPYFSHRMVEPWLQALYQANPAAPPPDVALSQSLRGVRAPVSLWGVFFAPGDLTAEGEGVFYFTNRLLLLLPLGVFFLKRKLLGWLVLPPLLYLVLVLGAFPATNLRYLVPVVPALTLAVTYILLEAGNRYLPRRLAALGVMVLATLALAPSGRAVERWLEGTQAVSHLIGSVSASEYWSTHLDPGVRAYLPVVRQVNESVPEDALILMLFEARGFPLKPPVLQDNMITNWPYFSGALPEGSCGEGVGADYLLLASAALNYYRLRGLDPDRLGWDRFQGFAERCLEPVFQVPGYVLFQWRPPSPTPSPPSAAAEPPDPRAGAD